MLQYKKDHLNVVNKIFELHCWSTRGKGIKARKITPSPAPWPRAPDSYPLHQNKTRTRSEWLQRLWIQDEKLWIMAYKRVTNKRKIIVNDTLRPTIITPLLLATPQRVDELIVWDTCSLILCTECPLSQACSALWRHEPCHLGPCVR